MTKLPAARRARTPSGRPDSPTAYGEAITACRTAVSERARLAADLGPDPAGIAELLELLRATLHMEADQAIDAEALRHPSPRRLIFRAPRYRESA